MAVLPRAVVRVVREVKKGTKLPGLMTTQWACDRGVAVSYTRAPPWARTWVERGQNTMLQNMLVHDGGTLTHTHKNTHVNSTHIYTQAYSYMCTYVCTLMHSTYMNSHMMHNTHMYTPICTHKTYQSSYMHCTL